MVFRCPLCEAVMQVDDSAAGQTMHCLDCGELVEVPQVAMPPRQLAATLRAGAKQRQAASQKQMLKGALVLAVIVIFAAAWWSSGDDDPTSATHSSAPQGPTKMDAWFMAQQFLEKRLKSPGSADYGSQDWDDVVTELGDNRFRVIAWVDSQNSFGALLRTHFEMTLVYLGDDRWRMEDLQTVEQ